MSSAICGGARRAFTLLELLVVIAIISILLGLLFPTLVTARRTARSGACAANLHTLGVAGSLYSAEHNDQVMPSEALAGYHFWPTLLSADFKYIAVPRTNNAPDYRSPLICPETPPQAGVVTLVSVTDGYYPGLYNGDVPTSYGINGREAGEALGASDMDNCFVTGCIVPAPTRDLSYQPHHADIAHPSSCVLLLDGWGFHLGYVTRLAGRHTLPLQSYPLGRGKLNVLFVDGHVQTLTRNPACTASCATNAFLETSVVWGVKQ